MSSLFKSTGIVALSTMISRILGFARDMLMASYFGATRATDVFFVAFMIPNIFRRLVAEGALTISFIPVYTDFLLTKGEKDALELAQKTFTIQFIAIAVIVIAGIIFSPEIMILFSTGFKDPATNTLAIELTRIMFPYLIFVGFVAFSMGLLNSHGYFFAPAFSPVFLNIGFMIGILFFSTFFTEPLYGVALGVLFGGLLQFVLQIPYLIKSGFKLKISVDFNHPGIRKIFSMIGPALFGIAVAQFNVLTRNILAAMLPAGSVTYLYYTDRLTELVLGVFIISIGNVILPEMSRISTMKDFNKLKDLYLSSINAALFVAIPASIALMVIGFPIISVFFMRGEFTVFSVDMTNISLFYASIATASHAILRITVPTFYSLKDTKTPVIAATVSFILNISFGYVLMNTELKHAGLSLALSLATTVQMLILIIMLQRKIGKIDVRKIFIANIKFLIAGAAMGIALWFMAARIDWAAGYFIKRLIYLGFLVIIGSIVYFFSCYIMRVSEVEFILKRIRRFKNKP